MLKNKWLTIINVSHLKLIEIYLLRKKIQNISVENDKI